MANAQMIEMEIQQLQQGMTQNQQMAFQQQFAARKKSSAVTFVLALFLPGIDRMYLGQIGLGILKLLLCEFVIWPLIDLFNTGSRTAEKNKMIAMEIAQRVRMTVQ